MQPEARERLVSFPSFLVVSRFPPLRGNQREGKGTRLPSLWLLRKGRQWNEMGSVAFPCSRQRKTFLSGATHCQKRLACLLAIGLATLPSVP